MSAVPLRALLLLIAVLAALAAVLFLCSPFGAVEGDAPEPAPMSPSAATEPLAPETSPAPLSQPPTSHGGDGGGGPVGQWVIDEEHLGKNMTDLMKRTMPPGQEIPAGTVEEAIAGANVTLDVKGDGTWTATGSMQGDPMDDAGTWTLDGDQLTVVWKKKDGKPGDQTVTATFEGDAIEIKPEEDMPFALRMIRR